jgi:hypothetical protein
MEIDGQPITIQHNGQPQINDNRPKMRPTYLPLCGCDSHRVLLINGVLRCGECYAAYCSAGSYYYTDKFFEELIEQAPTLPKQYSDLDNERIRDAALVPSSFEGKQIPEQFILRDENDKNNLVPTFRNGEMIIGGE